MEVNCRKVCNLISAYIDEELPGVEALQIRQHLSNCPECHAEYEDILQTKRLIASLVIKSPLQDPEERIQTIIEQCRNTRPVRFGFLTAWSLLPPAQRDRIRLGLLCTCCAALLAILLLRPSPTMNSLDTMTASNNLPLRPYVSAPPQIPVNEILVHHDPWEFMNTPNERGTLAPVSSTDIVSTSP
jgi:hypothetical protein